MQKRWVTYLVVAILVIGLESLAIWMGSDDGFGLIRLEGRQIWVLHRFTRVFLWVLTALCEIIAVCRTYYWSSSYLRSYMLLLFSLYFGIDFIMPLTLATFPEFNLYPYLFGLLVLAIVGLMTLSFFKDKLVTVLMIPSLAFMVLRILFKTGIIL